MMLKLVRHMLITAALLGSFAVLGTSMVVVTHHTTAERIARNERDFLLRSLNEVVPPSEYDNDLHADTITVTSRELLGSREPVTVYRARKNGVPVAAILTPVAPDGYNGAIRLLVAIRYDTDTIMGVRVLTHRETPGLGDAIEPEKSSWIEDFSGRSLSNPDELGWHVEKDGGVFDQFTGATITPRAVVKAVHNSLKYYRLHKDELFRPAAGADSASTGDPGHGAE